MYVLHYNVRMRYLMNDYDATYKYERRLSQINVFIVFFLLCMPVWCFVCENNKKKKLLICKFAFVKHSSHNEFSSYSSIVSRIIYIKSVFKRVSSSQQQEYMLSTGGKEHNWLEDDYSEWLLLIFIIYRTSNVNVFALFSFCHFVINFFFTLHLFCVVSHILL